MLWGWMKEAAAALEGFSGSESGLALIVSDVVGAVGTLKPPPHGGCLAGARATRHANCR